MPMEDKNFNEFNPSEDKLKVEDKIAINEINTYFRNYYHK